MAAEGVAMTWTMVETPRGSFGLRLHGEVAATAGLVFCVHGFPDDASTFDSLADNMVGAGYQVAAMNMRGYAPSPLEGPLGLEDLVADILAVIEALSPDAPVHLVGHDYGAQLAYPAMSRHPRRFRRAVLMSGAHPAFVQRNARRALRQLWMSRYIVFFQLGRTADRRVMANNFAYIDRLWRLWSPGTDLPAPHRAHVKDTLRSSMPGPLAMYRAGGFSIPPNPSRSRPCTSPEKTTAAPCHTSPRDRSVSSPLGTGARSGKTPGTIPNLEHPLRTAVAVINWIKG